MNRTILGPCHYNFSSEAIVETKLPLHGGWCWTWETFQFSDGLGVLGRNDASVRWGWPHKSCSPPIIVGLPECSFLSANTTGLKFRCYWVFLWLRIHENRCLKLHLWHHAKMGLQKFLHHRNKNHTDFEPKTLTKQFQFQFIKSCSKPFKDLQPFGGGGGGWSVKYDVKESSPFSSQVMMGWRRTLEMPVAMKSGASQARKWFNGREMSNQRNTHRHTHKAGDPWGNWLLPTTLQLHFLALICI